MHGLKFGSCRFWQRTAHVGESNSRSNVFRFRHAFVCVPSHWKVLSGEFRRRPTSLAVQLRKSDRVGRRGLFEPREDFSRLNTYAWTQIWFVQILAADCPRWRIKFSLERFSDSVTLSFACPAAGKFSRASSAGGRRHLRSNFVNRIVSVDEDCLSPERTFHGCTLMQFSCRLGC
jgi:hypothetical protein